MTRRTRFAPSPTGHLHVGNARTALFNWLFTRHHGGSFILRIEDTDKERSRPEYEETILEDLRWLGLDWDEGVGREGDSGPYRQSERGGQYRTAAGRLLEQGHAYYCFCSEERLEADREADRKAGLMPRYPGRCRSLALEETRARLEGGERAALRFRVPEGKIEFEDGIRGRIEVDARVIGDPVLVRGTGSPAYNFAVVVDDIGMRITDVIRGEDHLSNTPRQVLLYRALGATPPRFTHLPLVLGMDGSPLSKRHGDTSLRRYRERGYLPAAVVNYLSLLGWAPPAGHEVLSREELVRQFELSRVTKAAGVFDPVKLDWVANQHLRTVDAATLADLATPFLQKEGLLPGEVTPPIRVWLGHLLELLKESIASLDQVPNSPGARLVLRFEPRVSLAQPEAEAVLRDPEARQVIRTFTEQLDPKRGLTLEAYHRAADETGRRTGAKGKSLYRPIRVALSGAVSGPELVRLIPLIEEAAGLDLPRRVPGCAERCRAVVALLGEP